jgi:hypothetical protein
MGRTSASPAVNAMTIDQCRRAALQHVSCPAANASTSELHVIHLPEQTNQETMNSGILETLLNLILSEKAGVNLEESTASSNRMEDSIRQSLAAAQLGTATLEEGDSRCR